MGKIELTCQPEPVLPYTAAEIAVIQGRLWRLLQRQVMHYTGEESSSVPVETAQELFQGLCFLIRQGLWGKEQRREGLLSGELDEIMQEGLRRIEAQIQEGLRLYQQVRNAPPPLTNRAYRDTVRNILTFFRCYQPQFTPHLVPCSIDYQLFLPVNERLSGIVWLNRYLTHLTMESRFLQCWDKAMVEAVENAAFSDYEDLLVNLYEPVFQNALGRMLLQGEVCILSIAPEEREELKRQLNRGNAEERRRTIVQTARGLAQVIGRPGLAEYLHQSALAFLPRLEVALRYHSLEHVFFTC